MTESHKKNAASFPVSTLKKVWCGLKAYLTDWRNLLGHALLGIFFLILAVWAPIRLWIKLLIILCLILLNILRMRNKKKDPAEEKE